MLRTDCVGKPPPGVYGKTRLMPGDTMAIHTPHIFFQFAENTMTIMRGRESSVWHIANIGETRASHFLFAVFTMTIMRGTISAN